MRHRTDSAQVTRWNSRDMTGAFGFIRARSEMRNDPPKLHPSHHLDQSAGRLNRERRRQDRSRSNRDPQSKWTEQRGPLSERSSSGLPCRSKSCSSSLITSRAPMERSTRQPSARRVYSSTTFRMRSKAPSRVRPLMKSYDQIWLGWLAARFQAALAAALCPFLPLALLRLGGTRWPSRRQRRSTRLRLTRKPSPRRAPRCAGSRSAEGGRPTRSCARRGAARTRAPACGSAGWSSAGRRDGRPDAPIPGGGAPGRARHRAGAPGSPFSPLEVLEQRDVERLLGHDLLQAGVLLLQRIQALRLVFLQGAVLDAPAIEGLVGDAQPLTGLGDGQAWACSFSASRSWPRSAPRCSAWRACDTSNLALKTRRTHTRLGPDGGGPDTAANCGRCSARRYPPAATATTPVSSSAAWAACLAS